MLKKVLIYIEKEIPVKKMEQIKADLEESAEVSLEFVRQKEQVLTALDGKELPEDGLVITDSGELAGKCRQKGIPIIIYLHKDNRNEDFAEYVYVIEDLSGIEYAYLQGIYDRFHKNPWKILETERCIVREMTEEDTQAIYDIYSGASPSKYMEKLPREQETYTEYIGNYIDYIYGYYEYGMWVIVEKLSGKVIGRVGIEWKADIEGAELGYVIDENYQRCGFAYEVCCAAIDYVTEKFGIQTLFIVMDSENIPSQGLAQKLGFVRDSTVTRQNERCQVYRYHCGSRKEDIQ